MATRRRTKNQEPAPTDRVADRELLERCMEALERLVPIERWKVRWPARRRGTGPEARLELRLDGHVVQFAVEARRGLRRTNVGPLAHRAHEVAEDGRELILCTDRVPDALGADLREAGICYVDLGGNTFLRGPGLFVLVTGRPAVVAKAKGALTGTEVRLLDVFLRDADAGEVVQKELAARAGIALGAVGRARERLEKAHVLTRLDKRRWRVTDREAGLQKFAEGWATVVRHKLHPKRFRLLQRERRRSGLATALRNRFKELGCLLGGERAAARLTLGLHTDHLTLHAPAGTSERVARNLRLAPDPDGPITLLDRFGRGDRFVAPKLAVPLAHPLLVWAECLTVPDERVAGIAAQLRERFLEEAP